MDKAIADREFRRMGTLREIYRGDLFLARRLERTSQQIIDGELARLRSRSLDGITLSFISISRKLRTSMFYPKGAGAAPSFPG